MREIKFLGTFRKEGVSRSYQYSVFECDVTPDQWVILKAKLLETYQAETDSLRFYHLGSKWRHKVEHHGAKVAVDVFKDTLII